jgi:hypothetical protein
MSDKELLHFGSGAEMVVAIEALFGMWLAEQGKSADALDDVVLPAVGGQRVMDRERGDGRQRIDGLMLFESFEAVHFEIETVGKERGKFRARADSQETFSGERLKAKG